jgi:hypothetical protein
VDLLKGIELGNFSSFERLIIDLCVVQITGSGKAIDHVDSVTRRTRGGAGVSGDEKMRAELRCATESRGKDWRRTIGAFTDDEGVKGILQEAMRLQEIDRQKARSGSQSS